MNKACYFSSLFLAVLFASFGLMACKGEQQEVAHEELQEQQTMYFQVDEPPLPAFKPSTSELLLSWPAFQDFQREVAAINGKSLIELRNRTERLLTYADSISRSAPDSLNVRSLQSRLVVVNTQVSLLDQGLNKDIIDSAAIAANLKGLLTATAHFYRQINQKLQKDAIDIQRREDEATELERQQQFRDSVFREELRDKNQGNL
jgi:hypothetical protein